MGCDPAGVKTYPVTLLQIGILSGTRAIAAAGLAFVLAEKIPRDQRRAIGWSLLGSGTVVFVGLLIDLLARNKNSSR